MKDKKKNKDKEKSKDQNSKLESQASHADEVKRLNRITGQIEGIRKMLENGRSLNDVLIQFKAVHSAMRSIEQRIFQNYVGNCVEGIANADKRKEREAKTEELLELFKQSA